VDNFVSKPWSPRRQAAFLLDLNKMIKKQAKNRLINQALTDFSLGKLPF
jgi:hypothetical protein